MSKQQLRQQYRAICRDIPLALRQTAAISAANLLAQQLIFQQSEHIACYLSVKNEFDTHAIIDIILQHHKKCYLPVLTAEKKLQFVHYHKEDNLQPNRYGIPEPTDLSLAMPAENLDMVLVPLVAFDLRGHRLGTGGGFYDRTFSFLREHPTPCKLIGLGFAAQQIDRLPADPWDIQLHGVLTEKECKMMNFG